MKTSIKKHVSILLVAVMLLSLSVGAFADGEQVNSNTKQFEKYCSLGDSVAYGIYYDEEPDIFPRIVARTVGAVKEDGNPDESLWVNKCGMRLVDMAAALHAMDFCFDEYASDGWGSSLRSMQNKAETYYYENLVEQADLITIELGINDIMYAPFSQLSADVLLGEDSSIEEKTAVIEKFFSDVAEATANLKGNYHKLLDRIKEIKGDDDYTIVLVGLYNTNNMMNISEDIPIPIGNTVTSLIVAANAIIKQVAADYGYGYADIYNVPTGSMMTGFTVTDFFTCNDETLMALCSHPSYPEGYSYIARQVIAELSVEEVEPDRNIRVDLGPVTEVTSVTLGTTVLPASMYSFDPETHILTVKNNSTKPGILTVVTKNEDRDLGTKTIGTYIYTLIYDPDSGYSAYLTLQTHDIIKTATTVVKGLGKVASAIGSSLKGLLKK